MTTAMPMLLRYARPRPAWTKIVLNPLRVRAHSQIWEGADLGVGLERLEDQPQEGNDHYYCHRPQADHDPASLPKIGFNFEAARNSTPAEASRRLLLPATTVALVPRKGFRAT